MANVTEAQQSFYDEVGGAETFQLLVSRFYQLVRDDEILRPLYPEDDLDGAEHRLRMFLEQYWGGPRTYGQERGHPRLRMRHAPFRIGYLEREETYAEHYTRKLYSFDHGTTWNARLELARKAAGRKVITIHFNTRKEMAWGAIQDINRRYGF